MAALQESPYPVDMFRLDSVIMQQGNLEEMTPEEGLAAVMLFSDSLMTDGGVDLATELEPYAFFVLNGFLFEELAYRDPGNSFLRCTNLAAIPGSLVRVSKTP